jgi:hypothetical protein
MRAVAIFYQLHDATQCRICGHSRRCDSTIRPPSPGAGCWWWKTGRRSRMAACLLAPGICRDGGRRRGYRRSAVIRGSGNRRGVCRSSAYRSGSSGNRIWSCPTGGARRDDQCQPRRDGGFGDANRSRTAGLSTSQWSASAMNMPKTARRRCRASSTDSHRSHAGAADPPTSPRSTAIEGLDMPLADLAMG